MGLKAEVFCSPLRANAADSPPLSKNTSGILRNFFYCFPYFLVIVGAGGNGQVSKSSQEQAVPGTDSDLQKTRIIQDPRG